ncbi:hypothetical protein BCT93_22965 [Vibrio lentus]|uniref:hypothetical protein n=1 Tax=Vibrio lentus TaxID=136468 RepID=UPI000C86676D|nr:hypothetical protein [Vibrio lentus]PMK67104.1 hypothetical protein BCT93_22965 [Vibrio lentus]
MKTPLISLDNGLYLDAVVTTADNQVQFLSVWGRDGAMQHFFAALTLPMSEGGIRAMTVKLPGGNLVLDFAQAKSLTKRTTRLPKHTPVGEWVHTWLIHPSLLKPNGQSMTVMSQTPLSHATLWPTLKQLCHLPLLEHWQPALQPRLQSMIHELPSYGVFAYHLDLQIDVMEPLVSEALQQGVLTVPQGAMG